MFVIVADMKVSNESLLGPDFENNGKENITVKNLLLHNAGFPPDPKPSYGRQLNSSIIIYGIIIIGPAGCAGDG